MHTLSNGLVLPDIGYGTFDVSDEETAVAVKSAIDVGYRLIDTASFYGNERGVGQGLRDSGVPRSDLIVTTKIWKTDRGYDKTIAACHRSLELMGLDYIDILLIHWPADTKHLGQAGIDENAATWHALEDLYDQGLVKAIGVSNFLVHHLEELAATACTTPMVDQIELHPGWAQEETRKYCQAKGIVVEGWSPLGRRAMLENPTILSVAASHDVSAAQICLRWSLQHGVLPLPKSSHVQRMAMNLDIFDFSLTDDDMARIDAITDLGGHRLDPDNQ